MAKQTSKAAAKPLSIPKLILKYNEASGRERDAKREVKEYKEPLKAFAEQFGVKTGPTEKRAEQVVDGYTCIVYLGLAQSFEPDVAKVIDTFGLQGCLEAGLLSVNVEEMRKLAISRQIKSETLGLILPATPRIGKCEAIKVKR